MAGGDAGLAAGAFVEIDLERILFTRCRPGERNQVAIITALERDRGTFMLLGEAGDRGE